jgi:hypothetical protein
VKKKKWIASYLVDKSACVGFANSQKKGRRLSSVAREEATLRCHFKKYGQEDNGGARSI